RVRLKYSSRSGGSRIGHTTNRVCGSRSQAWSASPPDEARVAPGRDGLHLILRSPSQEAKNPSTKTESRVMTTSDRAVQLADRIERGEVVRVGGARMAQEVRSELERRGVAYSETLS